MWELSLRITGERGRARPQPGDEPRGRPRQPREASSWPRAFPLTMRPYDVLRLARSPRRTPYSKRFQKWCFIYVTKHSLLGDFFVFLHIYISISNFLFLKISFQFFLYSSEITENDHVTVCGPDFSCFVCKQKEAKGKGTLIVSTWTWWESSGFWVAATLADLFYSIKKNIYKNF